MAANKKAPDEAEAFHFLYCTGRKSVPGDNRTAEAIIDAGANDVGGDPHSFGNAWHYVEIHGLSEINVQVLKLCRPVRRKGGFYARASRPARAEVAARCGS